jgi:hypothetical protein
VSRPATFILHSDRDRQLAVRFVLNCPLKMQVRISKLDRTNEQNRKCWLMLGAIVKAGIEVGERTWDEEDWYEILASAYLREKGLETGKLVQGLMGEMLTLGRIRPSKFTTEQFGEFLIVIEHFMATKGVELPPQDKRAELPPEAYSEGR